MQHLIETNVRNVPNFPKQGINFKDIGTLLANPVAFQQCIDTLVERYSKANIDIVLGLESRGFIVGVPLALALGKPFLMVRKPNKLPGVKVTVEYQKEYGTDSL